METYKYDDVSIYNYNAYNTAKESNYQYQQMYLFPDSQGQMHSSSTNDEDHHGKLWMIIGGVVLVFLICVSIIVTNINRKKRKFKGDYAFNALDDGGGVQMGDK
eukprot:374760_1